MTVAVAPRQDTTYRSFFPDWTGPRPVGWFFMEELLEARAASSFPTNGHGPDEVVNVYLARLLETSLAAQAGSLLLAGPDPVSEAPSANLTRRTRAQWYRAHGDHRLLSLGIFGRGDLLRRHRTPRTLDFDAARGRDLQAGRLCYDQAAHLLAGRGGALAHLAPVMRLLADHFPDYVHVLSVLATRRWDLGAVLGAPQLADLLQGQEPQPAPGTMDDLLDMMNEHRTTPDEALRDRVTALASDLGVEPARLGLG